MHNVYTDLDSLLDTRHALLYCIDPELSKRVIDNLSYRNRKRDQFENLSMDIFRTLYRNRGKSLLEITKPTHISGLISKHIITEMRDLSNDGIFKIYVNTQPYDLTDEEVSELLTLLCRMFPEFIGIEIVNMSYDEVDPNWIKDNEIKTMFMYEAMAWLEYQNSTTKILTNPIGTSVMLYGPDIVEANMKDELLTMEFFKNLMVMFSGIINYIPIDVKFYNTILDVDSIKK